MKTRKFAKSSLQIRHRRFRANPQPQQSASEHVESDFRFFRHAARRPRRLEDDADARPRRARHGGNGRFHRLAEFPGDGAARRRQRHVDAHEAAVVDIDLVDEAELVDVAGNLGIEDRLESGDQLSLRFRVAITTLII